MALSLLLFLMHWCLFLSNGFVFSFSISVYWVVIISLLLNQYESKLNTETFIWRLWLIHWVLMIYIYIYFSKLGNHIYVYISVNSVIIDSGNGLAPAWHQTNPWTSTYHWTLGKKLQKKESTKIINKKNALENIAYKMAVISGLNELNVRHSHSHWGQFIDFSDTGLFSQDTSMVDIYHITYPFIMTYKRLTLLVLKPECYWTTRSIPWLLMPWLLASPGHQHPWHCWYRIKGSLCSTMKDFKHLCPLSDEEW